jgi:hypothetical protein
MPILDSVNAGADLKCINFVLEDRNCAGEDWQWCGHRDSVKKCKILVSDPDKSFTKAQGKWLKGKLLLICATEQNMERKTHDALLVTNNIKSL